MKMFVHDKEECLIGLFFKMFIFYVSRLWFCKSKRKGYTLFWPFGYENEIET